MADSITVQSAHPQCGPGSAAKAATQRLTVIADQFGWTGAQH